MSRKYEIVVGDQFGRLTVLSPPVYHADKKKWVAKTKCSCGTEKYVAIYHLLSGTTLSCGCYGAEQRGKAKGAKIHGLSDTDEYRILSKIKERCYLKSCVAYKYYGARGIKVCSRWLEPKGQGFVNFVSDMGKRPSKDHSIDRIDVNGDYEPSNCRWVDKYTQARNKRSNNYLTYKGETKPLTVWAYELNINPKTLFTRIYDGWSVEKALSTPSFEPKKYTLDDVTLTIKEWSDKTGIPLKTLEARLSSKDWTVEKALSTPLKKPLEITFAGKTKTVREWCKELGCGRAMIEKRIRSGKDPALAVKEVADKRGYKY